MSKSVLNLSGTAGALFIAAAFMPAAAQAQSSTSTLNVTAEVQEACLVSTTPINFGTVDVSTSANKDANGSLLITCTDDTAWTANAGVGSGSGASYTSRRMTSGSNQLSYNIYTTAQRATVFGDGSVGTLTITGIGTGAQQSTPVYGRVAGSQNSVPAGSYADTVAITVTY